jgi:hypothetical protein
VDFGDIAGRLVLHLAHMKIEEFIPSLNEMSEVDFFFPPGTRPNDRRWGVVSVQFLHNSSWRCVLPPKTVSLCSFSVLSSCVIPRRVQNPIILKFG